MTSSFVFCSALKEAGVAPASAAADVVSWGWFGAGAASGAGYGVLVGVGVFSRHFVCLGVICWCGSGWFLEGKEVD
jgi:hypothetical protein